jgi:hypothetical protein
VWVLILFSIVDVAYAAPEHTRNSISAQAQFTKQAQDTSPMSLSSQEMMLGIQGSCFLCAGIE